ncbi:MAG TPA: metallophosphoesterase [Ktedonobacterales bacterium]|nr:metallophosphoesterase [Ktedonobacterales bacterium]
MEQEQLPNQAMTYAVGDIHGEVTLLKQLLALLPYREQDTLVFLGDYLDRGEDSIATVRTLQALKREHPACVFLRGNHEDAWLDCWNGYRFFKIPSIDGALDVWEDQQEKIPFELGDWLEETLIEYEDEHAYYVHAGVLPGKPVWRTSGLQKMWGAQGFVESAYDWGKPIVFGHRRFAEPLLQPNKIGIDTGAFKSGKLTAVRVPDRYIFQAHGA